MRTRVAKLASSGGVVAVAWFTGDKDESFLFGNKPEDLSVEVKEDDYRPLEACRFMVSGSVLKQNQFREDIITTDTPFHTTGNLEWCRFTILEDKTIGYCLDISNSKYRFVAPHRLNLEPNETRTFAVFGYLCPASGSISIDGRPIAAREIVTLSGTEVEITAGDEGAQVGALELEYV